MRMLCRAVFSLKEAKALVKDLGRPVAAIYWTDFLLSICTAHILLAAEIRAADWMPLSGASFVLARLGMFTIAALLYMRSVMFIHELVHLRSDSFRGFRVAWNLLCGIPCMVPSFMYYPHVDHHRRKSYGTDHDGEYIELSHKHPAYIVLFILVALIVPPLAFFRFLVLTLSLGCGPPCVRKLKSMRVRWSLTSFTCGEILDHALGARC